MRSRANAGFHRAIVANPMRTWHNSCRRSHCFTEQGDHAMMLENKVAIVTGGDSGIGRAIVLALAQAGAAVAINYHRNQAAAEEVRHQVEQGGKALAIQGDVAKVADVQTLVEQTIKAFGRLDIMVN